MTILLHLFAAALYLGLATHFWRTRWRGAVRSQVQEVNRLLNQFEQTQKVMKQFSKGGMQKMMRGMKGMLPGMR